MSAVLETPTNTGQRATTSRVARWSQGASNAQRSIPPHEPEPVALDARQVVVATNDQGRFYVLQPLRAPVAKAPVGPTRYSGKRLLTKADLEADPEGLLDSLFAGSGDGYERLRDAEAWSLLRGWLEARRANANDCRRASVYLALTLAARRGVALRPEELPL